MCECGLRVVVAMLARLQKGGRFLRLFSKPTEVGWTIRFGDPALKFGSIIRFRMRAHRIVAARVRGSERVAAARRFVPGECRRKGPFADRTLLWRGKCHAASRVESCPLGDAAPRGVPESVATDPSGRRPALSV